MLFELLSVLYKAYLCFFGFALTLKIAIDAMFETHRKSLAIFALASSAFISFSGFSIGFCGFSYIYFADTIEAITQYQVESSKTPFQGGNQFQDQTNGEKK